MFKSIISWFRKESKREVHHYHHIIVSGSLAVSLDDVFELRKYRNSQDGIIDKENQESISDKFKDLKEIRKSEINPLEDKKIIEELGKVEIPEVSFGYEEKET